MADKLHKLSITDGIMQDDIMLFMIYNWFYNAMFIIIGILLYVIIPNRND